LTILDDDINETDQLFQIVIARFFDSMEISEIHESDSADYSDMVFDVSLIHDFLEILS